ncbi:MAG: polysaccharide deacetylase family protein [Anaerovoracaceae bacterium]|jgi:peptidoglycan/xylan/chitin deacetylase (PgdA/CDA1 family)/LysM repeat protein
MSDVGNTLNRRQKRFLVQRLRYIIPAIALTICLMGTPVYADKVHRVLPGETLSGIANHYGITQDSLLGHNQFIADPNLIFSQQILIIPTEYRRYHLVKPGDTLSKISQAFSIPASMIANINDIKDENLIYKGEVMLIPKIYTVKPGDTLYSISNNLSINIEDFVTKNALIQPDSLYPGQQLIIPYRSAQREELVDLERELSPAVRRFPDILFYKGKGEKKQIALTFDDGPGQESTDAVLDILKKYKVPATFFILGTSIQKDDNTLKRILSDGHVLASHTSNHPDLRTLTQKELIDELLTVENRVYEITGRRMALMRPPYGFHNDSVLEDIGNMGYRIIKWSVDTKDWRDGDIDRVLINTMPNIRNGSIILMHDTLAKSATNKVLPEIIQTLSYHGYTFVTVDELLGINAYK